MSAHRVFSFRMDLKSDKPIVVEYSDAPLSSDGGLLPIRQFDETIGLTQGFAGCLNDARDAKLTVQSILDMVRQRVYGLLAGYEDQNDHDTLRFDPVFKLVNGREVEDPDLASQPTLSRFENSVTPSDLFRCRAFMLDNFVKSFTTPPTHLTFDVDAFDSPTHGDQQLTMFHGFYEQHQYYPLVFTCAENDMVVQASLRMGVATASLGADEDLREIVDRVRKEWPDVRITLRGDTGFAVPTMYNVCRELGIEYTFGFAMNARLKKMSEQLAAEAEKQFIATGVPQRLFMPVMYEAGSWGFEQRVVIKAEHNEQGPNRRAVVTNRDGWHVLPGEVYEDYARRGESENRNKEMKLELHAARMSCHRFMANYFRLFLSCVALNLLIRLRQATALPKLEPIQAGVETTPEPLPAEALPEPQRRKLANHRRERDPLGEGFGSTWRLRFIKVAVQVVVRTRRVIVRLTSTWPHREEFERICGVIAGLAGLEHPTG